MKIELNYKNLTQAQKAKMRERFLDQTLEGRKSISIDLNDVDLDEMSELMDMSDQTAEFAIWLEVDDSQLTTDIPLALSFSEYVDEKEVTVRRKWGDFELLMRSTDGKKSIRYLTGVTDKIRKDDLALLRGSSMRVFNTKKLAEVRADEGDDYWVDTE